MQIRVGKSLVVRSAVVALGAALSIGTGAATPAGARDGARSPRDLSGEARLRAVIKGVTNQVALLGAGGPDRLRASAVMGPGTISEADNLGEADARVDISNVTATMKAGRIRFSLTLPTTPDPRTDAGWQYGQSAVVWAFDANNDDLEDYEVVLIMDGARSYGGVISADGATYYCNANFTYSASRQTFSGAIPLRCVGSPTHINFQAGAFYDTNPFGDAPIMIQDFAPDASALPLDIGPGAAEQAAGYLVDGFGRLRSFNAGSPAPSARSADSFGFDIIRGLSSTADGGHAYIVDGYGGVHGVALASNAFNAVVRGGPYWPGWDIARGIAVGASGRGGYVLDGYGGLHSFGLGVGRGMPAVVGGPYWSGWDIARGVAVLPNGRGGFVVDAYGGLHWFNFGKVRPAPKVTGAPYWSGQDLARGVTLLPDGSGGYVVDASGALHPFGIDGPAPAAPATGTPLLAHGVTVIPKALNVPGLAPPLVPPVPTT